MRIGIGLFFILLTAQLPGMCQLNTHKCSQLDSLMKVEERPILIFIETDWCKYCHAMKAKSFANDSVKSVLNEKFWFATLDAETKENISFRNDIFSFKPQGNNTGTHELAIALGTVDGKLTFPTLCILNSDYEITFQYAGYLTGTELFEILKRTHKA